MFFNKFTIKDYKCFQGEQSLLLAIPQDTVMGSGLTYVVGGNNSGKTTLIEGLSIKDKRNIKTSERIVGADPEFYLYENDALVRKNALIRSESSTIEETPKLALENTFEIISSRRHWASTANSSYSSVGESFASVLEFTNRQNNLEKNGDSHHLI